MEVQFAVEDAVAEGQRRPERRRLLGAASRLGEDAAVPGGPFAGGGDPWLAWDLLQRFLEAGGAGRSGERCDEKVLRLDVGGGQFAAEASVPVASEEVLEFGDDFRVGRGEVLGLGRIGDGIIELRAELVLVGLAGAILDLVDGHALDPFPTAFAEGEHPVGAMDDQVLAALGLGRTREHVEETPAILGAHGLGRERCADDLGGCRQDIDQADHLGGCGASGYLAGPAGDEGYLEATFPYVVFPASDGAVDLQAGLESSGLEEAFDLGLEDAAIVAREDHQRILGRAHLVERGKDAADALVEFMDPVSVESGCAPASEILVGRDRVMDSDWREVEEEGLILPLGFKPGRRFIGQHLHDALIFAARGVELEDAARVLAVLGVFGSVGRLVVVAVRGGTGEFHAGGNLPGTEAVDEAVLDEDAGEVAVVARDAEVVVEADVEGARGEFGLILGAPLRVFVFFTVAEVPFAHGGGVVAFLFQQGG